MSISWYVAVAYKHDELFRYFLRGELYGRLFTSEHHRDEPLFYYAAILPAAILPWLIPVFRSIFGRWRAFTKDFSTRLILGWIALPLVMFTISRSKLPTYILPLVPALALLAVDGLRMSRRSFIVYFLALMTLYHGILAGIGAHETELHAHSTTREMARVLIREFKPGDRVVLVEKNPRGLSFYLRRRVSVPISKFNFQIRSDVKRAKDKDYRNVSKVFNWFETTQRVFMVCSYRVAAERQRDAKIRPRELYRDSNFVLISNQ